MAEHIRKDLLPYHKRKYTEYEITLRTQLADEIGYIARYLNSRSVLLDYQLKRILKVANPEDGVSELINILKGYQGGHFDAFMECLTYFGHDKLVEQIKGEGPVTRNCSMQMAYKKVEDDTGPVSGSQTRKWTHNGEGPVTRNCSMQMAYKKVEDDTGPVSGSQTRKWTHNDFQIGSMNADDKKLWISLTERIVTELQSSLGDAMMRLYQAHIIDLDDKKRVYKVLKEQQEVDAARELVDILVERGDNVLKRIIRALKPRYNIAKELECELNNSS